MKSLRQLQRERDARLDPDRAVRDAVAEYLKHPSPRLHAAIGQAMQHLVRMSGGVHNGRVWRAP